MTERTSPDAGAATALASTPTQETVAYRTLIHDRSGLGMGHVQRKWRQAAATSHAAMALEHRQLVQTIHLTDGISEEQAELQVTAFEKHFKDDPA